LTASRLTCQYQLDINVPNTTTIGKREKAQILKKHRGMLSRVQRQVSARRLLKGGKPITLQAVWSVWHDKSKSAEIEKALDAELDRILNGKNIGGTS